MEAAATTVATAPLPPGFGRTGVGSPPTRAINRYGYLMSPEASGKGGAVEPPPRWDLSQNPACPLTKTPWIGSSGRASSVVRS